MEEKQIQQLLKIDNSLEFHKKLIKLFPDGINLEKVDKRIQKKIQDFIKNTDEYNDIQNPIQLRKNNRH